MRVLISVYGSRGDIQPMVALALRLRQRGHEILFSAPPNFESWLTKLGIEFHASGLDVQMVLQRIGTRWRPAVKILRTHIREHFKELQQLGRSVDAIVGASIHSAGPSVAEAYGIPYKYVVFAPVALRSREHCSPLFPWQSLPSWLNDLSWRATERVWNSAFREAINDARRELGLGPITDCYSYPQAGHVLLVGDPAISIPPSDARVAITQTGSWFYPDSDELDPSLEEFLSAGPPPVYIGFGSMTDEDPRKTTRCMLEAVRRANVRALISKGWANFTSDQLPPEVRFIGPAPHAKLFPRLAAVVHHGGAGTTAAVSGRAFLRWLFPIFSISFGLHTGSHGLA